jgi:DNA-directed RNA polymerase alpha subunit
MITESQYLDAKYIVEKYEKQQQHKLERFQAGDVDLLTVLSERPRNAIIKHNEDEWTKEGEEIIYISDVVKLINRTGNEFELLKFRNLGRKSYDEIMNHVRPFLNAP